MEAGVDSTAMGVPVRAAVQLLEAYEVPTHS